MATDRITSVAITYENADGTETMVRTYNMNPVDTYAKDQHPQGLIPGVLNVFGGYRHYDDTEVWDVEEASNTQSDD